MNCDKCKETDDLIHVDNDALTLRLRFDTEHNEIDCMVYNLLNGEHEHEESIKIAYCPFCGRKLSGGNDA